MKLLSYMATIEIPNVRQESTVLMPTTLKDNGVAVDWSGLQDIKAYMYSDAQRVIAGKCDVEVDGEDATVLKVTYAATRPQYLGVNSLLVRCKYHGREKSYDVPVLNFVERTAQATGMTVLDDPVIDVKLEVDEVSTSLLDGAIAAALDAAVKAEEAASLVPLQVLEDCVEATENAETATAAANEAAEAANAAGITSVQASVADNEPGTPSVEVSLLNKVLSLVFHHLKGLKGDTGATPNITVGTVATGAPGTPVVITMTGTAAAPVLNITIPQGLKGDKGDQGNTGSSVEFPYELVNNLTTNDATKGLSAAQGVVLDGKISQLDQEIGDMSDYREEGWEPVAVTATKTYYFKFDTLAEYSQSLAEYAVISVQPGEKYSIDGWNWSSNAPLAFVRKAETTTKARAIYQSSAAHMSGEYTIPEGYDTLYVNGRTANYPVVVKKWVSKQTTIVEVLDKKADVADAVSAPLHVAVKQNAKYVAGSSTVYGWNIAVGRRFNNSHDVVWFVGNKNSSINNFFDFQSIYLATRGEKKVNPESSTSAMTYILGHVTDYILPIVVAAVNNIDGDFPDNTSYYTGGYHGYGNATDGEVSQTMRQVSRSVRLDGKELVAGDSLYGSVLEIDVVNNVQGCNTEKENGSGREIIQQHIHITMDAEKFDVTVEWTALESVNVHTLHCFGEYFDFADVRFVGSTSKPGTYTKGTYQVTTDKNTSIVRNVGDDYTFEVEMDANFGVRDSFLGSAGNALATTSNKGYFNAVGDTPISMNSGDMVAYRGCYRFYPTPATT